MSIAQQRLSDGAEASLLGAIWGHVNGTSCIWAGLVFMTTMGASEGARPLRPWAVSDAFNASVCGAHWISQRKQAVHGLTLSTLFLLF